MRLAVARPDHTLADQPLGPGEGRGARRLAPNPRGVHDCLGLENLIIAHGSDDPVRVTDGAHGALVRDRVADVDGRCHGVRLHPVSLGESFTEALRERCGALGPYASACASLPSAT